MLFRLYYRYEKSPNKTRALVFIVEDLKKVFEFPRAGNVPVHSQGSRWINHKRKALQRVLDHYGAYIGHLTTLAEDSSVGSLSSTMVTFKDCYWLCDVCRCAEASISAYLKYLSLESTDYRKVWYNLRKPRSRSALFCCSTSVAFRSACGGKSSARGEMFSACGDIMRK